MVGERAGAADAAAQEVSVQPQRDATRGLDAVLLPPDIPMFRMFIAAHSFLSAFPMFVPSLAW
jgi:hypothetical protein